ncbi:hypothetical protein C8Q70DRAFT_407301 [Cubamyces menziesii]|nr:hypothetical protein C8Q70DRAFT_407301 [Cubamyces menziesii]
MRQVLSTAQSVPTQTLLAQSLLLVDVVHCAHTRTTLSFSPLHLQLRRDSVSYHTRLHRQPPSFLDVLASR